ncbi:hypothetical protein [Nocardia sp. bgisy134]|uniref:hypothetical protein n=1 Tax=Nocardia sp. bgisy134 TaxID=3413789 RepID=UPI003D7600AD
MTGAATGDFRITVSAAVIAAALTLIAWHGALLGMAQGAAVKALAAVWFMLGWGFAPGALTAVIARSALGRLPRVWAISAITAVSLLLTTGVCYVVYAYLTDPAFMDAAMGAPANNGSGADHAAHHSGPVATSYPPPRFEVVSTPTLCAVALSLAGLFTSGQRQTPVP